METKGASSKMRQTIKKNCQKIKWNAIQIIFTPLKISHQTERKALLVNYVESSIQ